ncbi:MAG: glycosyltransferase, partial [Pseudomonadota bacterium]
MTRLAVVVTTYNRPDALEQVLSAYLSQADHDIELLVADDGSTDDTRAVVERFAQRTAFPVHHVWHEDDGFRAGAIR